MVSIAATLALQESQRPSGARPGPALPGGRRGLSPLNPGRRASPPPHRRAAAGRCGSSAARPPRPSAGPAAAPAPAACSRRLRSSKIASSAGLGAGDAECTDAFGFGAPPTDADMPTTAGRGTGAASTGAGSSSGARVSALTATPESDDDTLLCCSRITEGGWRPVPRTGRGMRIDALPPGVPLAGTEAFGIGLGRMPVFMFSFICTVFSPSLCPSCSTMSRGTGGALRARKNPRPLRAPGFVTLSAEAFGAWI